MLACSHANVYMYTAVFLRSHSQFFQFLQSLTTWLNKICCDLLRASYSSENTWWFTATATHTLARELNTKRKAKRPADSINDSSTSYAWEKHIHLHVLNTFRCCLYMNLEIQCEITTIKISGLGLTQTSWFEACDSIRYWLFCMYIRYTTRQIFWQKTISQLML